MVDVIGLVMIGAGAVVGNLIAHAIRKKEPLPIREKQCAATGILGNSFFSSSRCNGISDNRCLGGQCTAHCVANCKGECLK